MIKEEAFERMKNDPEYENYVLNRVRSAYSVQGLPVGSNNVSLMLLERHQKNVTVMQVQ